MNLESVASNSASNSVKIKVKVDSFTDENFLREARLATAAVWDSWIKARAANNRGEKHVANPVTFKLALENASKKMYPSAIDACTVKLGKLDMVTLNSPNTMMDGLLPI